MMAAEDGLSVERASLCKAWLLPLDEDLSAQWVLEHDDPQTKAVFWNLFRLRGLEDVSNH
jgi:hypothetical protein